MPSGGRPLVIVKAIPASMIARTTAPVRGVRTLSGVTSVPSTSATTRRTPLGTSSFSDIRLYCGVLQHADGLEHQRGANPQVVGPLVCLDAIHLRLRGRHQQLEHEQLIRGPTVVRQLFEPRRLASIEGAIALRVVAH